MAEITPNKNYLKKKSFSVLHLPEGHLFRQSLKHSRFRLYWSVLYSRPSAFINSNFRCLSVYFGIFFLFFFEVKNKRIKLQTEIIANGHIVLNVVVVVVVVVTMICLLCNTIDGETDFRMTFFVLHFCNCC